MDSQMVLDFLTEGFDNPQIPTPLIITVLLMAAVLGIYEYLIYRYVSKRSFYSKQFNIVLAVLPLFISTIIMTLQSNLLITLGTIGALAIIRFRTAIKDPIDMVYLLWSIHIGITCGSGLYQVAVITSVAATILLLVLDLLPFRKPPFILLINANDSSIEDSVIKVIKERSAYSKVKSRNLSINRYDLVVELKTNDDENLLKAISAMDGVTNVSLVSYEGENFA